MTKCPECEKEIDHLKELTECWVVVDFPMDKNKTYKENIVDFIPIEQLDYDCPCCGATLFHNLDDARAFLEGN